MNTILFLTAAALCASLGLTYPTDFAKGSGGLQTTAEPVTMTPEIVFVDDSSEATAGQRYKRSVSLQSTAEPMTMTPEIVFVDDSSEATASQLYKRSVSLQSTAEPMTMTPEIVFVDDSSEATAGQRYKRSDSLQSTVEPMTMTPEIVFVDESSEATAGQRYKRSGSDSFDDRNVARNEFLQTTSAPLKHDETPGHTHQRDGLIDVSSTWDEKAKFPGEEIEESTESGPSNPVDLLTQLREKFIKLKEHII
ncbi:uncharacterized protein LOC108675734 [Hyalella azteca]|uniref:Uncharacterized protein LOC108675734 n=1 Tax=Hyalella azteca TaxID=294128 RepID=A0A8B7NZQ1_HYAAZ|nr:uncharacterized protein LOC108675734 [Hyalella azteca]